MLANNRPRNLGFWQSVKDFALNSLAVFSVMKFVNSAFKLFTGWLLVSQGKQPTPLNTVSYFECSDNADLFFKARAFGTFDQLAHNSCNPLEDNLVDLSKRGLLTGFTDFQEIKTKMGDDGKFQTIQTDIYFAEKETTMTQYNVTGPLEKFISDKQPDPTTTYVYSGVKDENGKFCRAGYKYKCG